MATNVILTIPLLIPPFIFTGCVIVLPYVFQCFPLPTTFLLDIVIFNNNDATPFYPCEKLHGFPNLA